MELNDAIALLTTYNRWRRGEDENLDMPNPRDIGVAIDTVLAAVTEGGTGNSGAERPEPSPHFLQGNTPETDALLRQQDRDSTPYDRAADQLVKLCRKLERERDEAVLRREETVMQCELLASDMRQWRECAENLIDYARECLASLSGGCGHPYCEREMDIIRKDIARFERLKEDSK